MAVIIKASERFPRSGTRAVTVAFKDTDGSAVTPDTVTWTLTNRSEFGTAPSIINLRDAVSVTPSTTVNIVLTGLDLAFLTGEKGCETVQRLLLIEYVYDSATMGNNVPDKIQYEFEIQNFQHLDV